MCVPWLVRGLAAALQGVDRLVGNYGSDLESSLSVLVPAITAKRVCLR